METFKTKGECDNYLKEHNLDAISMPRYSECDGELLYFYIYYV